MIGAGLGGLAVSCLLASEGHTVTVFEKNEKPGGKINEITSDGFRFDTGPSLLTMPFILEQLFARCDKKISDFLTIRPVDPICRYSYKDGTAFSCYQNTDKMLEEISRIAPEDVENYQQFMDYASALYRRTKDAFLFNPLYGFKDLGNLNIFDFLKIDAFKTVSDRIDNSFQSPYLRQFFKRFATYNGSSPYQAPATLNIIPHVELALGGFYIEGGIYRLVQALTDLAKSTGVNFAFNTEIQKITSTNDAVTSVVTKEGISHTSDIVLSNSDASATYLNLLTDSDIPLWKKESIRKLEPSCSGFVLLLGIDKEYEQLKHHNIFFSSDYQKEFKQIFQDKVMPDDPTIYIANTSSSDKTHAPTGGSNLFVLVNAPYLNDRYDWQNNENKYTNFILAELEERGLSGLRDAIQYRHSISPVDFEKKYNSNKGSIYGTSSNSKLSAFMRPKNKSKNLDGLYLVGGSTHPGGGIPLVILSAFNAMELIQRYENDT